MKSNATFRPVVEPIAEDPAGLDKLLLAAGKGVARFLEAAIESKLGRPVPLWDGPDGLGAVLDEHLKAAGVPNKRLPELLTPRAVVNSFVPVPFPGRVRKRRLSRKVAR